MSSVSHLRLAVHSEISVQRCMRRFNVDMFASLWLSSFEEIPAAGLDLPSSFY